MRRILVILFAFCSLATVSVAQELVGTIGISIQSLKELKGHQMSMINNSTFVPLKSTQSFPPYLQYQLGLRFFVTPKIKLGGTMYLTSTAARSAASDYSGEVSVDQKLACFGGGGFFSYTLRGTQRWNLALYAIAGIDVSRLETAFIINAHGIQHTREVSHADAVSAALEGGLEFQYNISDHFVFHANAGLHLGAPAMLSDDYDQPVVNVNWSGAKLMTGICYRL